MKNSTEKKAEIKIIGKVGSHDVADYGGYPCLCFGKRMMGLTKIKDVLSDVPACKEFVAKYDKPATGKVVSIAQVQTKEQGLAAIAEIQAQLSSMNAGAGRIDPVSAQA